MLIPRIARVLETAIYVDDLDRAATFYRDVLGLRELLSNPRLAVFDAGRSTILLVFHRGGSAAGADTPTGRIPPHDGHGPAHFAFAVDADQLSAWEARLAQFDVAIESRVVWERGGQSLYFRDPDGHSVELATPGVWATY